MGRRGVWARFIAVATTITALTAGLHTAPALAIFDNSSEFAVIGPVRATLSAGQPDAVYGASFVVIGDAFAENVITADDTVVITLTGATSGTGQLWLSRTNRLFPAGAGQADDTLSLMDPTTTPAPIGSGNPFTIITGDSDDDTVLQTYIAVSAAGTYSGDVYIYEGTAATMSPASVVQHTTFRFTTAGAPRTIVSTPDSLNLIATPADQQSTTIQILDDSGAPTQLAALDRIAVTTSSASIADPVQSLVDADAFDDSLSEPLGSATLTVRGGTAAGAATITLTPQGTLPAAGVQPATLAATSRPLSSTAPGLFEMVSPTQQRIIDEARSTDDTAYYIVNDLFITNVLLVAEGADPDSGVVGYVSTSASNWRDVSVTGGGPSPVEQIDDSATDVAVVLATGSDGTVSAAISWASVTQGGVLTLRTGIGADTKWTVIEVEEPTPAPRTSPSGRIITKAGSSIDVLVTLRDDFGNAYPNFRVNGQARSSRGTPLGPVSSWERTGDDGRTTVTVEPPDDTYAGTATIVFTVTLPNGLPFAALTPPVVRVTYSESGQPSALTVTQAQSTPSTITAATTPTVIPHVFVPYTGRADTAAGTPGTWVLPTPDNPTGSGAAAGTMVTFTPTSVPATQITVRAPDGVGLGTSARAQWDGGEQQITVDSGDPVYAFATAVGTHAIEFTVGELTTRAQMRVSTSVDAAYSVESRTDDTVLAPGEFSTMAVRVVDVFGNPIANTTDDSGGVLATATGQLLFAGYANRVPLLTDDSGIATITVIAGRSPGTASVQIVPPAATRTPAWQVDYRPPVGLPPPVSTVEIGFQIGTPPGPSTTSIIITGERGDIRGRSGIIVDGLTEGLPDATLVMPYLRFPGQTSYTPGTARRAVVLVDVDQRLGDFTWQRRTGKKTSVYFATEDGSTRSTRIVIPAA